MKADITLEKTLPQSIDSEKAVLGAILLDDKAIFAATETLLAEDFYLESHGEIFRAMLHLVEEESAIDFFTLREELRRRNKEEIAGGTAYLASLTDGLPRALNVAHYSKTIREKSMARQLIRLSNETTTRCYQGEERPAEILEQVESQIFKIAARDLKGGFQPALELAGAAYKEIEEASKHRGMVSGLDTGFSDLNRMTGGLHKQNLVVVAARPGLGKTSFCLNIACHAAVVGGRSVGIFSLEMSKPELMKRMISSLAEVDANRIQSGYLAREDWSRINHVTSCLADAPLYIDDSANLTMLQVRAKAQRLAMEHGVDLLVVDYLQLVSGSRRYETRGGGIVNEKKLGKWLMDLAACYDCVPQKAAISRYLRILGQWKLNPDQWEELADRAVMRLTRKFPMPGDLHEIASELWREAELCENS